MDRKKRYFITDVYNGSDRDDFHKDFCEYLRNILKTGRWEAMSEHQLFLQGAKKAIEEIIEELSINDVGICRWFQSSQNCQCILRNENCEGFNICDSYEEPEVAKGE